jgi:hypothetical protein
VALHLPASQLLAELTCSAGAQLSVERGGGSDYFPGRVDQYIFPGLEDGLAQDQVERER